MRCRFFLVVSCLCLVAACTALAQDPPAKDPGSSTATCNFDDQKQLAIEYQPLKVGDKDKDYVGHKVPYGKVWEPGKQPLTLFTNSPISLAGSSVAPGAYTMYLIPERNQWTLVLSRNTDLKAKYDQSKDLVRAPMQTGQLMHQEPDFSVYMAHTGPKECTMRIDVADTRAWVPFEQK
jgi:hypothetical protein